jgi:ABC-type transport system involved in multi-copper enzyme maturation permease subunit
MACSAISSEREKQTLPLILITRITPGGLIAEKFLSRLVPMMALLLITLPMLSIAYMLGGLRLEAVFAALLGLLTAAVQVNSAAIMCSALFRTALEAFWATYFMFAIMGLGPPLLYELDLLPDFNWFPMVGNEAIAMPFVLFLGMSVGAIEGFANIGYVLFSAVPPFIVAAVMLVISRVAIAHGRQDAPFNFQTIAKFGRRAGSCMFQAALFPWRLVSKIASKTSPGVRHPLLEVTPPIRAFPTLQPVAWRECQISALSGWRLNATLLCSVILLESAWLIDVSRYGSHSRDEVCVIVDIGLFILCLLMVVGVSCRTFASERERQTLDLLLTTPLTNHELLSEKLSAANRTILFLMVPLCLTAIMHTLFGRMRVIDSGLTYSRGYYTNHDVSVFDINWWYVSVRYLFGVLTHIILYMSLAKWIAVYFSLRFNSQMKAMLGTILSVVGLCIIPAMLIALPMMLLGTNPDQADLPIWYLTSPAIIFAFNEVSEFNELFRSHWWPRSEYFTLLVNLVIYGGLTLAIRAFVIAKLPTLLSREDSRPFNAMQHAASEARFDQQ